MPWGPTCILCQNGNKFDLDILSNRFYNYLPKDGWAFGVNLEGSEGDRNQVSSNQFQGDIYIGYQSFLSGVTLFNFKNTRLCSNALSNAYGSFLFVGQNDGTEFTSNTVYGAGLLTIAYESWIEDQDQQGNQWILPDFANLYANPQVLCQIPDYATFSEFRVHTPQSTAIQGPGFNPYHPKDIVPDDSDEWWSQISGTPVSDCLDEVVGDDTNLKRAVAGGTLAAQINNPSLTWQAERALYFALKRNPALEGEHPSYAAFLAAKTGSNIDKFYQVATALDAVRNGSANLITDAKNNHTAIENLLAQVETADQAWQSATSLTVRENAKNTKKQKLGELMGLLQNASSLQAIYKQSLQTGLTNALQINSSVSPTSDWETYEKATNGIFISYLQNGGITGAQKQQLEAIAEVCPKYGGMAVYKARGILPDCAKSFDRDNNPDCYPAISPLTFATVPRSNESRILVSSTGIQVSPNPADESATVSVPHEKQGRVRIVNAFGQALAEHNIVSPQTTLSLNMLPVGIYYLDVLFVDGQRECLKLVVSR